MTEKQEPKFEDALGRLEAIVSEMEQAKVDLDTSIARFEEGMRLAKMCEKKLGETEKRIEILMRKDKTGEPEWESFGDDT